MGNVDPQELAKFSELAHRWWDTDSEFQPLHAINPLRLDWIDATASLAGKTVLDVGCGVGGSTRRLSHQTGCCVTGIDLSNEYIDAAERLTQLLNMQERVKFHACSALQLPFEDNSFDGVWSIQMNMNVEDKLAWMKETYRVLKPGGRAVLYEVCGNKNTPVYFPVPWAQDSSMSFLVSPESFRDVIISAGFDFLK